MLCALIMAGGKGERFWPLSTKDKPKQFLKLLGNDTMIQMTVKRLNKLIPLERIFIITNEAYLSLIKDQLPDFLKENIIVEPVGRNTAPCIALSAFYINKFYKDATIVVVPSDHLIVDDESFLDKIRQADNFLDMENEACVTIGIKPERPETGFGYIRYENEGIDIFRVDKFVEKPSIEKAKEYINKGNYLWNCGIFIWKTKTILSLTQKYLSKTFDILREIAISSENGYEDALNEKYCLVDNIAVDYGILEKAENLYVIKGEFGWDDVGTWSAIERHRGTDNGKNVCIGEVSNIESYNNVVVSSKKPIVVVGLDNMFIVESENIIFISNKKEIENINDIKKMVGN